jgi:hypothetical protein
MWDKEAYEGPADESLYPTKGEESTVEEIETHNVTTVDNSDQAVTGAEGNTVPHKSLWSLCQEINTFIFLHRYW